LFRLKKGIKKDSSNLITEIVFSKVLLKNLTYIIKKTLNWNLKALKVKNILKESFEAMIKKQQRRKGKSDE